MTSSGQRLPKRASASRPSGEWNDDDFDVLADGRQDHERSRDTGRLVVAVDLRL